MKNCTQPHTFRRSALCVLLCSLVALLGGCARRAPEPMPTQTPMPSFPRASVSPAPTLTNQPADVYAGVLTDQRAVSLVLEGYTNDTTMQATLEKLKTARVPAVFFVSGIVANEHPDVVAQIAQAGFTVGNYGLNAEKNMQDNDVNTNIHQFQRGQELISAATGITPTLFRCNSSTLTREVLQAAAYTGLQAGVQPGLYLNHVSFKTYDDALLFVQKLARGSILSVKLGQALDADEFDGAQYSMDNLAVDPPPMLADKMEDTVAETYANIPNVVGWLIQALEAEGYAIVSPQALQAQRITMFDAPRALSAAELALVDPDNYPLPVTPLALSNMAPPLSVTPAATATDAALAAQSVPPTATVADASAKDAAAEKSATPEGSAAIPDTSPAPALSLGDHVVFVGDSVTQSLENYAEWRRGTEPDFLAGAAFLTSADFSVGMAEMKVSATSAHPSVNGVKMPVEQALTTLGAKTVLLMPGQGDVRNYSIDKFIENLKLMVYQIRKADPYARLILQSLPPGVAQRYTQPPNDQIFRYNLAMYKFCLQFDLSFADVAFPLRDAQGDLPDSLCMDADTYGIHPNDNGCERWLTAVRNIIAQQN